MSDDLNFSDTNMVDDLVANCNQLRDRCWKAEEQLTAKDIRTQQLRETVENLRKFGAKWRAIAIKERAKVLAWERVEKYAPHWTEMMEQAAKELDLQISQEDDYLS
jgi:hypothetical protein